MPHTLFDGDFRQRPEQNFSGSNRNLQRDQLIQNAALERKQREAIRKHTSFVIDFQSKIRGFLARKKLFDALRSDFDDKLCSEENSNKVSCDLLSYLLKRIVLFYSFPVDRDRLLSLDRLLVENKERVMQLIGDSQSNLLLRSIFVYNGQLLAFLFEYGGGQLAAVRCESIALLFKVFLSFDSTQQQFVMNTWRHLVSRGYFQNLRQFVEKMSDARVASLPDFVYENFLLNPLLVRSTSDEWQRLIVSRLLGDFFSKPHSTLIKCDIFPRICDNLPPNLNGNLILDSSISIQSISSQSFLWTFYSILKILFIQTNSIDNERLKKLYSLIHCFSVNLSLCIKSIEGFHFKEKHNNKTEEEDIDDDDDEDDDDEGEEANVMKVPDQQQLINLVNETFSLLNQSALCNLLVRQPQLENDSLCSLSFLCHSMLLFGRLEENRQNRLLRSVAFDATLLRRLWQLVNSQSTVSLFDSSTTYLRILTSGVPTSSVDWHQFLPPLTVFCALFNYFLQTLDDYEFFNEIDLNCVETISREYSGMPFKLSELILMGAVLRDICISLLEMAYQDRKVANLNSQLMSEPVEGQLKGEYNIQCWNMLLNYSLKLLRHIYARDIRRQFCPPSHWISKRHHVQIMPSNFNQAIQQRGHLYREFRGIRHLARLEVNLYGSPIPVKEIVNVTIIQELPFVVPFPTRVHIMQSLINWEKRSNEGLYYEMFNHSSAITVRRDHIYDDAFEKFSPEKLPNLKRMVRIQLISRLGLEETGIDGGGVFREFLSEALKEAFNPLRGLFKTTTDELLYPNPSVHMVIDSSDQHYYFIGRLLGKAIYENMLTELPLAPFFLAKLLTKSLNSDVDINHLASMDPVLYKNLISLKNYTGDVSELGLDFSVITSDLGTNIIEELKPNGRNIPVNNSNRIEYIRLMSNYKLNRQIRNQCAAFKQGFYNVVNLDWIKMFDTKELQILLSGAHTPIDLEDLMAHTVYSGGYHRDHKVIQIFWEVVTEFEEKQKGQLLKFITSCSRPPLLGFKDLYPALCIQNAGKDGDRLPTSSTCMNLLKLPEVYDKTLMREKLLYSINSGSGFELS